MRELHVIFGAGQIGRRLADELLERGQRVRIVRRGPSGAAREGLEWARGDLGDAAFRREAARGASVVYNCVNPGDYSRWSEELPPLFAAVRDAAAHAGAKLVVLDNLYMYGPTGGEPMREETPMRPLAVKSALRARLAGELFEAHERGEIVATSGRASDFFGPGANERAVFGMPTVERIASGRAIDTVGDPSLPHALSYAPDVARGLAVLGTSEASWGRPWHLPVAFQGSVRELAERFASELGTRAKVRAHGAWMLRVAGVFAPPMGALVEMLYQWREPFLVDDSAFRATFGLEPTPLDAAVRETIEAMRAGRRAAA